MNKNILYLTRQVDLCVKWLKEYRNDTNLQKQVDNYFEEGEQSTPGLARTSPQTESDEQI